MKAESDTNMSTAGSVLSWISGSTYSSTPRTPVCFRSATTRASGRISEARPWAFRAVWITCQEMNAPVNLGGTESNRPAAWKAVAEEIARD